MNRALSIPWLVGALLSRRIRAHVERAASWERECGCSGRARWVVAVVTAWGSEWPE